MKVVAKGIETSHVGTQFSLFSGILIKAYRIHYTDKGKGKVHPSTGHESSEGEKKYSSTLSLTSAVDRCGWLTPRSGRFTSDKDPIHIV
jgi:hypothetical protein